MKLTDLYTRDRANAGRRIPLPLPDGSPSGEFLTILHPDSDTFRRKRSDILSAAALLKDVPDDERRRLRDRAQVELMACLITGWTLEDPYSEQAAIDLLSNAPYLADVISRESENAEAFFGNGSASSSTTAEPKQG